MGSLAILALLGMGILAATLGGDDDSAEDMPDPMPDPDPEVDPSQPPLAPTAMGTTFGTMGDDDFDTQASTFPRYFDLQDGSDSVIAGSGDDTIVATGNEADTLNGGAGDDQIFGGDAYNDIFGGEGDDTIVNGDGGARVFLDTEGANLIYGGAGNENFIISGESTVYGGGGVDSYSLHLDPNAETVGVIHDFDPPNSRLDRIVVNDPGDAQGTLNLQDRADFSGVDIYYGDTLLTTILGAAASDIADAEVIFVANGGTLTGTDGNDFIRTSNFAETVMAGAGDDYISNGLNLNTGPDLLNGGEGNDTIVALGVSNIEYSDLNGDITTVLEQNVLNGGAGDDLLVSTYSNIVTGGEGADVFAIGGATDAGPSEITDFDPAEDVIYINDPSGGDGLPTGVEINVWSDGNGADLIVGDILIARITGGQDLTVQDIQLARLGIGIELLGFH